MNKTKLFVARDKAFGLCENGMVHLFGDKPYRYNNGAGMEYWKCDRPDIICLGEDAFPELKWEDEPLQVELNEVGLPSVNQIVNVLTCIEDYQQKVFRYGVRREELRTEQAKEIQEYIRKYYNYWWLPSNERGVELPSTKHDAQDEEEVQEMQSDIDELERICNEMTDEEFLESYRESTKGMRDETKYDDVFSERPCDMGNKYTKPKTEEEVTNLKKTMGLYTIYCTEEQTKKALELGAPIEVIYTKDDYQQKRPTVAIKGEFVDYDYFVPTAEELIGWLENQGLYFTIDCIGDYVYEVWTKDTDKIVIIINSCVHTRKEATLSAIDAALEHLNENQK